MAAPQGVVGHDRLRRLLDPRSVAIIGATPRGGAFGKWVLANLDDFHGPIRLVNARYQSIDVNPLVCTGGRGVAVDALIDQR